MKQNEIVKEITKLGLSEKLILVEDIWDDIARNNEQVPMPQWQKTELGKRYQDYKNGKLNLYNWEDVHKKLRNKYK
ncbi:MAG: addiction module protein [Chitinivibrionales bacterium]|nr:addiction module protein [Chitinivibrionales bacterium]